MNLPRPGIRTRVVLSSATAIAIALAVFAGAVHAGLSRILKGVVEAELRRSVEPRPGAPFPFGNTGGPRGPRFDRTPAPPPPRGPHLVRMHSMDAIDLNRPDQPPWSREGIEAAARTGESWVEARVDDTPVLVLSRRIPRGDRPIVLQTMMSLEDHHAAMDALARVLQFLLPIAVALSTLVGWAVVGRILQPVQTLTDAAARLSPDDPEDRLPTGGDDEFGRLARMLDSMVGRLRESAQRQRRFAGDAAHELRTPLAVIKTTAQITRQQAASMPREELDEALSAIETSADQAALLTTNLLLLARGSNGALPVAKVACTLRNIVDRAIFPIADPESPRVENRVPSDLAVRTDPVLLGRILSNLIENATRHTPTDGTVSIEAGRTETGWWCRVNDSGCGIAPEHLPRIGEPFYRPDASRARPTGGAGLGLALCHTFVAALGGSLSIESTPGKGTRATVDMPDRG